ncbi:Microtubule-associated protein futsch [Operophtera brumata]|uniref:Microtubule-associated protein futsch n=1 Tax=Operophtera brumata TaxID=104452 RepID=A0A0L7LU20_OPEBR|nr:Microtubule-associated protein futsch [Operophtera brumata]
MLPPPVQYPVLFPVPEERTTIIGNVSHNGLLSWDSGEHQVDLEKELATLTAQAPEGEEARYGERLIQFASENLVTEILIHPQMNTLMQCMRNLLSSFTRHRHLDGTFSLSDFTDAYQENEVQRVIRAYENSISIDVHCSTSGGGEWAKLPAMPFVKYCKIRVNPTDILDTGSPAIKDFITYLDPYIVPASLDQLLVSSDVVGNIRFSHPTLYRRKKNYVHTCIPKTLPYFWAPALGPSTISYSAATKTWCCANKNIGFTRKEVFLTRIDGGFSRKACWWDFARHLDRLDAVLFTRLNNCSVSGMASVLRRKAASTVYPQIGHFFCNLEERRALASPDGDKDTDPLLVSLLQEGSDMMTDLRHLNLKPQHCYRSPEPINLYHKVGHGTLDMYVLNPSKDSKYVREFLKRWHGSEQKLFEGASASGHFNFPVPNIVSICALLVWRPANPDDAITRIMFPGSTPQHKIFEGLEKLKHLELLNHPTCTGRQMQPTPPAVTTALSTTKTAKIVSRTSKEKAVIIEKTKEKIIERENPPKHKDITDETDSKNIIDNKLLSELVDGEEKKLENLLGGAIISRAETTLDDKVAQYESTVIEGLPKKKDVKKKAADKKNKQIEKTEDTKDSVVKSTESKKSADVEIKHTTESKKKTESRTKIESSMSLTRSKMSHRTSQRPTEKKVTAISVEKKASSDEKKSPPMTPKKSTETKTASSSVQPTTRERVRAKSRRLSPGSTPAKSTKEAQNRRVVESKYKQASPKRDLTQKPAEKKETKKREPISRRPRPLASPVKGLKTVKSPTKSAKSAKADNTKLKGLQRVNYEDILREAKKSDEDTSKSLDDIKLQELDDREEQEIVREIEAVFNRDSEAEEKIEFIGRSDIEKITCMIDDVKTETIADGEFEEEYLIIEKEEVDHYTEDLEREESHEQDELQKHIKDKEESEKKKEETVHDTEKVEISPVKPDVMVSDSEIKQLESKEHSVSGGEKQDISSEKKTSDSKSGVVKPKDSIELNYGQESQPDEKMSTTVESGATTAPTLPEDERITLDDIKEDQQIEENYVQEETKETLATKSLVDLHMPASVEKTTTRLESIPAAPLRDIVKTPDEVADLPLHEEVDYRTYEEKKTPLEEDIFRRKPDIGFVQEIKVPKDLAIPEQPSLRDSKAIEDDVVIKTVQRASHAEIVTVTPGSAPESPMYHDHIQVSSIPGPDLKSVKDYADPDYGYSHYTEKLRETHITTLDSPIKDDIIVIDEVSCMPEKIPSIPEDVEKEIEETRKLEAQDKPPVSPKEIEKIVADVAEVLKSDKSLEEIMADKSPIMHRKTPETSTKTETTIMTAIEATKMLLLSEQEVKHDAQENLKAEIQDINQDQATDVDIHEEMSPSKSMTSEDAIEVIDKTIFQEIKRSKRDTCQEEKPIFSAMHFDFGEVDTSENKQKKEEKENEKQVELHSNSTKADIVTSIVIDDISKELSEEMAEPQRKLSATMASAKTLEKLEEKMTDLKKRDKSTEAKVKKNYKEENFTDSTIDIKPSLTDFKSDSILSKVPENEQSSETDVQTEKVKSKLDLTVLQTDQGITQKISESDLLHTESEDEIVHRRQQSPLSAKEDKKRLISEKEDTDEVEEMEIDKIKTDIVSDELDAMQVGLEKDIHEDVMKLHTEIDGVEQETEKVISPKEGKKDKIDKFMTKLDEKVSATKDFFSGKFFGKKSTKEPSPVRDDEKQPSPVELEKKTPSPIDKEPRKTFSKQILLQEEDDTAQSVISKDWKTSSPNKEEPITPSSIVSEDKKLTTTEKEQIPVNKVIQILSLADEMVQIHDVLEKLPVDDRTLSPDSLDLKAPSPVQIDDILPSTEAKAVATQEKFNLKALSLTDEEPSPVKDKKPHIPAVLDLMVPSPIEKDLSAIKINESSYVKLDLKTQSAIDKEDNLQPILSELDVKMPSLSAKQPSPVEEEANKTSHVALDLKAPSQLKELISIEQDFKTVSPVDKKLSPAEDDEKTPSPITVDEKTPNQVDMKPSLVKESENVKTPDVLDWKTPSTIYKEASPAHNKTYSVEGEQATLEEPITELKTPSPVQEAEKTSLKEEMQIPPHDQGHEIAPVLNVLNVKISSLTDKDPMQDCVKKPSSGALLLKALSPVDRKYIEAKLCVDVDDDKSPSQISLNEIETPSQVKSLIIIDKHISAADKAQLPINNEPKIVKPDKEPSMFAFELKAFDIEARPDDKNVSPGKEDEIKQIIISEKAPSPLDKEPRLANKDDRNTSLVSEKVSSPVDQERSPVKEDENPDFESDLKKSSPTDEDPSAKIDEKETSSVLFDEKELSPAYKTLSTEKAPITVDKYVVQQIIFRVEEISTIRFDDKFMIAQALRIEPSLEGLTPVGEPIISETSVIEFITEGVLTIERIIITKSVRTVFSDKHGKSVKNKTIVYRTTSDHYPDKTCRDRIYSTTTISDIIDEQFTIEESLVGYRTFGEPTETSKSSTEIMTIKGKQIILRKRSSTTVVTYIMIESTKTKRIICNATEEEHPDGTVITIQNEDISLIDGIFENIDDKSLKLITQRPSKEEIRGPSLVEMDINERGPIEPAYKTIDTKKMPSLDRQDDHESTPLKEDLTKPVSITVDLEKPNQVDKEPSPIKEDEKIINLVSEKAASSNDTEQQPFKEDYISPGSVDQEASPLKEHGREANLVSEKSPSLVSQVISPPKEDDRNVGLVSEKTTSPVVQQPSPLKEDDRNASLDSEKIPSPVVQQRSPLKEDDRKKIASPADKDSNLISDKAPSPVEKDSSLVEEKFASPANKDLNIEAEKVTSPADNESSLISDQAPSIDDADSSVVLYKVPSPADKDSSIVAEKVVSLADKDSSLISDKAPSIDDKDSSLMAEKVASLADKVSSLVAEKIPRPVDKDSNSVEEKVPSAADKDSSLIFDKAPSPIDKDSSIVAEKFASPADSDLSDVPEKVASPAYKESILISDKAPKPDDKDSSLVTEKVKRPAGKESSLISDKAPSPVDKVSSLIAEKVASPVDKDSTILAEEVASPADSDSSDVPEKVASPAYKESILISDKAPKPDDKDSSLVTEKAPSIDDEDLSLVAEKVASSADKNSSLVAEKVASTADKVSSLISDKAPIPVDKDSSLVAGKVASPADKDSSLISDKAPRIDDKDSSVVVDKVASPADKDSSIEAEKVASLADKDSSLVAEKIPSPVDKDSKSVEEKVPSPADKDSRLISDKAPSPSDKDSSIVAEKFVSPADTDSSDVAEKVASPAYEESILISYKAPKPDDKDSSLVTEKASSSVDKDSSLVSEKVASPADKDSSLVAEKNASPADKDSGFVAEKVASPADKDSSLISDKAPSPADKDSSLVAEKVASPADKDSSLAEEKVASPADKDSCLISDKAPSPVDKDLRLIADKVTSLADKDSSLISDMAPIPVDKDSTLVAEKIPSPADKDSSLISDKAPSPVDKDSSPVAEKIASPAEKDSSHISDKAPSPVDKDSCLVAEKIASPAEKDSSYVSEKAPSPVDKDSSLVAERITSPAEKDSSHISDKAPSPVDKDSSLVAEKIASPAEKDSSHISDKAPSPVDKDSCLGVENIASPAEKDSIHISDKAPSPVDKDSCLVAEKIASPAEKDSSHISDKAPSPVDKESCLVAEKISSPAEKDLSHISDKAPSPVDKDSSLVAEKILSPAEKDSSHISDKAPSPVDKNSCLGVENVASPSDKDTSLISDKAPTSVDKEASHSKEDLRKASLVSEKSPSAVDQEESPVNENNGKTSHGSEKLPSPVIQGSSHFKEDDKKVIPVSEKTTSSLVHEPSPIKEDGRKASLVSERAASPTDIDSCIFKEDERKVSLVSEKASSPGHMESSSPKFDGDRKENLVSEKSPSPVEAKPSHPEEDVKASLTLENASSAVDKEPSLLKKDVRKTTLVPEKTPSPLDQEPRSLKEDDRKASLVTEKAPSPIHIEPSLTEEVLRKASVVTEKVSITVDVKPSSPRVDSDRKDSFESEKPLSPVETKQGPPKEGDVKASPVSEKSPSVFDQEQSSANEDDQQTNHGSVKLPSPIKKYDRKASPVSEKSPSPVNHEPNPFKEGDSKANLVSENTPSQVEQVTIPLKEEVRMLSLVSEKATSPTNMELCLHSEDEKKASFVSAKASSPDDVESSYLKATDDRQEKLESEKSPSPVETKPSHPEEADVKASPMSEKTSSTVEEDPSPIVEDLQKTSLVFEKVPSPIDKESMPVYTESNLLSKKAPSPVDPKQSPLKEEDRLVSTVCDEAPSPVNMGPSQEEEDDKDVIKASPVSEQAPRPVDIEIRHPNEGFGKASFVLAKALSPVDKKPSSPNEDDIKESPEKAPSAVDQELSPVKEDVRKTSFVSEKAPSPVDKQSRTVDKESSLPSAKAPSLVDKEPSLSKNHHAEDVRKASLVSEKSSSPVDIKPSHPKDDTIITSPVSEKAPSSVHQESSLQVCLEVVGKAILVAEKAPSTVDVELSHPEQDDKKASPLSEKTPSPVRQEANIIEVVRKSSLLPEKAPSPVHMGPSLSKEGQKASLVSEELRHAKEDVRKPSLASEMVTSPVQKEPSPVDEKSSHVLEKTSSPVDQESIPQKEDERKPRLLKKALSPVDKELSSSKTAHERETNVDSEKAPSPLDKEPSPSKEDDRKTSFVSEKAQSPVDKQSSPAKEEVLNARLVSDKTPSPVDNEQSPAKEDVLHASLASDKTPSPVDNEQSLDVEDEVEKISYTDKKESRKLPNEIDVKQLILRIDGLKCLFESIRFDDKYMIEEAQKIDPDVFKNLIPTGEPVINETSEIEIITEGDITIERIIITKSVRSLFSDMHGKVIKSKIISNEITSDEFPDKTCRERAYYTWTVSDVIDEQFTINESLDGYRPFGEPKEISSKRNGKTVINGFPILWSDCSANVIVSYIKMKSTKTKYIIRDVHEEEHPNGTIVTFTDENISLVDGIFEPSVSTIQPRTIHFKPSSLIDKIDTTDQSPTIIKDDDNILPITDIKEFILREEFDDPDPCLMEEIPTSPIDRASLKEIPSNEFEKIPSPLKLEQNVSNTLEKSSSPIKKELNKSVEMGFTSIKEINNLASPTAMAVEEINKKITHLVIADSKMSSPVNEDAKMPSAVKEDSTTLSPHNDDLKAPSSTEKEASAMKEDSRDPVLVKEFTMEPMVSFIKDAALELAVQTLSLSGEEVSSPDLLMDEEVSKKFSASREEELSKPDALPLKLRSLIDKEPDIVNEAEKVSSFFKETTEELCLTKEGKEPYLSILNEKPHTINKMASSVNLSPTQSGEDLHSQLDSPDLMTDESPSLFKKQKTKDARPKKDFKESNTFKQVASPVTDDLQVSSPIGKELSPVKEVAKTTYLVKEDVKVHSPTNKDSGPVKDDFKEGILLDKKPSHVIEVTKDQSPVKEEVTASTSIDEESSSVKEEPIEKETSPVKEYLKDLHLIDKELITLKKELKEHCQDKEVSEEHSLIKEDLKALSLVEKKQSPVVGDTKEPSPVKEDLQAPMLSPIYNEDIKKSSSDNKDFHVPCEDPYHVKKDSKELSLIKSVAKKSDAEIKDEQKFQSLDKVTRSPNEYEDEVASPDLLIDDQLTLTEKETKPFNEDVIISKFSKEDDLELNLIKVVDKLQKPHSLPIKPISPLLKEHSIVKDVVEGIGKMPTSIVKDIKELSPVKKHEEVSSPTMELDKDDVKEHSPVKSDLMAPSQICINERNQIEENIKESIPITEDTTVPTPVNEVIKEPGTIKEPTPIKEHVKVPSPVNIHIKEPSYIMAKIKETIPIEEKIKEPTPIHEDAKVSSPDNEKIKVPTPVQEEIEELGTVKEVIREPIPIKEDAKMFSPVKEVIKEPNLIKEVVSKVSSSIKNEMKELSPVKEPTRIQGYKVVEEETKERSPIIEDAKKPSPVKECTKAPSPVKEEVEGPSPVTEVIKEPYPFKKDTKVSSPDNKGIKVSSPFKEGTKAPSPIKEEIKESSPVKADSKAPTPVKEEIEGITSVTEIIKESDPIKRDAKVFSPDKEGIKVPSPIKEETKAPSPVKEEIKESSPVKKDIKVPSFIKEEINEPTSTKEDTIFCGLVKDITKAPGPVEDDDKKSSPVKEEVKESSLVTEASKVLSSVKEVIKDLSSVKVPSLIKEDTKELIFDRDVAKEITKVPASIDEHAREFGLFKEDTTKPSTDKIEQEEPSRIDKVEKEQSEVITNGKQFSPINDKHAVVKEVAAIENKIADMEHELMIVTKSEDQATMIETIARPFTLEVQTISPVDTNLFALESDGISIQTESKLSESVYEIITKKEPETNLKCDKGMTEYEFNTIDGSSNDGDMPLSHKTELLSDEQVLQSNIDDMKTNVQALVKTSSKIKSLTELARQTEEMLHLEREFTTEVHYSQKELINQVKHDVTEQLTFDHEVTDDKTFSISTIDSGITDIENITHTLVHGSSSEDVSKEISSKEKYSIEGNDKHEKKEKPISDITWSYPVSLKEPDLTELSTEEDKQEKKKPAEVVSQKEEIQLSEASDSGVNSLPLDDLISKEKTESASHAMIDSAARLIESIQKAFIEDTVQQGIKTESLESLYMRDMDRASTPPTVPVSPLPKTPSSFQDVKMSEGLQSEVTYDKSEGSEETITKVVHVGEDILTQKISTSTEKVPKLPKTSMSEADSDSELLNLMQNVGKIKTETDTVTKIIKEGENVVTQTITTVTTKEVISRDDGTPQNVKTTIETTTLSKGADGSTTSTTDTQTLLSECSSSLKSTSHMDVYAKDYNTKKDSLDSLGEKSGVTTSFHFKDLSEKYQDHESPFFSKEIAKDTFVESDEPDESVEDTFIDTDVSKRIVKENNVDIVETVTTTTRRETVGVNEHKKIMRTTVETNVTKEHPDGSKDVQKNVEVKTEELVLDSSENLEKILKEYEIYGEPEESVTTKTEEINQESLNIKRTIVTRIIQTKYADHDNIPRKLKKATVVTTTDCFPDGSSRSKVDSSTSIIDIEVESIETPELDDFTEVENISVEADTDEKSVIINGKSALQLITTTTTKELLLNKDKSRKKLKTTVETITKTTSPDGMTEITKDVKVLVSDSKTDIAAENLDEGFEPAGEMEQEVDTKTESINENGVIIKRKTTVTTTVQKYLNDNENVQRTQTTVKTVSEDEYPDGSIITKTSEKISHVDENVAAPINGVDSTSDEESTVRFDIEDTLKDLQTLAAPEETEIIKTEEIKDIDKIIYRRIITNIAKSKYCDYSGVVRKLKTVTTVTTTDQYPDGSSQTTVDTSISIADVEFDESTLSNDTKRPIVHEKQIEQKIIPEEEHDPDSETSKTTEALIGLTLFGQAEENENIETEQVNENEMLIKRKIITRIVNTKYADSQGTLQKIKTVTTVTTTDEYPDSTVRTNVETRTSICDIIPVEDTLEETLEGFDLVDTTQKASATEFTTLTENGIVIKRKTTVKTIIQEFINTADKQKRVKTTVRTIAEDEHPDGSVVTNTSDKITLTDEILPNLLEDDINQSSGVGSKDSIRIETALRELEPTSEPEETELIHKEDVIENGITIKRTIVTRTEKTKYSDKLGETRKLKIVTTITTSDQYPDGSISTVIDTNTSLSDIESQDVIQPQELKEFPQLEDKSVSVDKQEKMLENQMNTARLNLKL